MENMQKPLFVGVATALATPFAEGKVDVAALKRMVTVQIEGGVQAIVLCGTTGEAATLTEKEKDTVLYTARETAGEAFPLIMGTGSNDTAVTLRRSQAAKANGANGLLVVTPYYNKGTKEGLVRHYLTVAEGVDLPLVVYNVPSRTGVDISLDTLERLCVHPNVRGIKEAGGNFDKMAECIRRFGERLPLYSGNDSQIIPTLALGGQGVISVVSNLFPHITSGICNDFFAGRIDSAREMQLRMLPLIQALFEETNPAPLKAALAACGRCSGDLRLPLYTVPAALEARLRQGISKLLPYENRM